ncbi:leucine-rich repeat protein soc-2 homolog [Lingula anatina]|uniref:Leucine-rich repeat protein soc-2 homolog n=1 Tax=Lingula anatina TaxID=7574 RepID=A0A1S3I4J0_LINAN|nr:leucine-rich repeat protein soc-2 homolog [Lingula anatina]|eukprot:XP_013392284.1 leucine-rich repeat protein soc-2 homolog [Lingula anatina]
MATAGKEVARVALRCQAAKEENRLDLSQCSLMMVPEAVFFLMKHIQLESCDLSANVLKRIPSKLGIKFNHLTELNLCSNRLVDLPAEMKEMTELKTLDISHNNFPTLPKVIYKLNSLSTINAEKNIITDVEVNKLNTMTSLHEVNLLENPLPSSLCEALKSIQLFTVHFTEPEETFDKVD